MNGNEQKKEQKSDQWRKKINTQSNAYLDDGKTMNKEKAI